MHEAGFEEATAPDRRAVVLMYHALGTQGDVPAGQDPHYTLSAAAFARQMARVAEAGTAGCVRDWLAGTRADATLVTFDDGHESNVNLAFPLLLASGLKADFFVNPANVGRAGFASWAQLRELHGHGMSIQSHGYDHTYLTDLPKPRLQQQLQRARLGIEDAIGAPVSLLAPPGGRMPPGLHRVASACGYARIVCSRPGLARPAAAEVPRMAVTAATTDERLRRWLKHDRGAILRDRARYATLASAKRLLGDARYERLRARALADAGAVRLGERP